MRLKIFAIVLTLNSLVASPMAYCQGVARQMANAVAMVKGQVTASDGSHPAGLGITFLKGSEKDRTTKTKPDGTFNMVLNPGALYRIVVNDPKFMYHEDTLNIPQLTAYQEYPVAVTLTALHDGQQFDLNAPVFLPKATSIDPKGAAQFDKLLSELKHNAKLSLAITVYPDKPVASKKDAVQEKIATARAGNLRSYLLGKGIATNRFEVTTVTTSVPPGRFDLGPGYASTSEIPSKKKKKPAPAKVALIPQYVEVVAHLAS